MTVEGATVWNLATLMPDGAVGASAAGGRAEFAYSMLGFDADTDPPEHGGEKTVTGTEVGQDSRCMHPELIDRNLGEARDVATAMPA